MKALLLLLPVAVAMAACGGGTETVTVTEGAGQSDNSRDECFSKYEVPQDVSACLRGEEPDEPAQEAIPDPKGRYDFNCDNLIAENDDYSLIAGGTIENIGNVGVLVRVKVTWQLLGSAPIVETRDVRVPYGRTRNVQISVPISGSQWDQHASADFDCKTKATSIDYFGEVHG